MKQCLSPIMFALAMIVFFILAVSLQPFRGEAGAEEILNDFDFAETTDDDTCLDMAGIDVSADDEELGQFSEYDPETGRTCYLDDIAKTAYVYYGFPDENFGDEPILSVGWNFDSGLQARYRAHSLIGFPGCPSGLLQTATLHYYVSFLSLFGMSSDQHTIKFRLLEDSWTEGGVTWNNRPSANDEVAAYDSWLTYDDDDVWETVNLLDVLLKICDEEYPNNGIIITSDNLANPEEITFLTEDYDPEYELYMNICYCSDCRIRPFPGAAAQCYLDGELNPNNDCQACRLPTRQDWTDLDGDTCDDGLFCTVDDYCDDGTCTSDTQRWCEQDGLWCNGDELCDEDNDECGHQNAPDCSDDGVWCNGEEFCDEENDECSVQNVPDCSDDGIWCNGEEFCDEDNDQCSAQNVPDCSDDGVWCNGEEFCDEDNDECSVQNVPDCSDDGVWCNGDEFCDEDNDACDSTGNPCPDDGVWCNGEEMCSEDNDRCVNFNVPACSDDGFWCNGDEFCDEDNDECSHQNVPDCSEDGAWCNGDEFCDEDDNQCASTGDPCDEDETCDEESDECLPAADDDDDDTADDDDDDDDDNDDDDDDDDDADDDSGCGC
ncbi:MAG: DNRLRE domain-containing protein [Candidatus Lernaella stagnicola]|nr:DNRLRE domain-containing protein [Candidatus Lernaella stagnicola]